MTVEGAVPAEAFEGTWQVERRIEDRQIGQTGRFVGQAVFEPEGSGALRYAEEGWLYLGATAPMRASRVYLWQFGAEGVAVRFADGRPFHSFVPFGAGAGTDHPCGEDLYRVLYDFRDWPLWWTDWEVTGPRKDYAMKTRYDRGAA